MINPNKPTDESTKEHRKQTKLLKNLKGANSYQRGTPPRALLHRNGVKLPLDVKAPHCQTRRARGQSKKQQCSADSKLLPPQ